jgi:ubiquinone/menaquinone biosynthesis C-methylase UbiE
MSEWNKKRSIMSRYDLTAHIYDMRYADEQAAKIEAALKTVKFEDNSVVLDAGCGTGILFDYIANQAKAIVGLDISKKILLEAKKHAKNPLNVHLILADADNMPLKERAFSHVFGMTLLQNMPNPARTLNEMKRTAKVNAIIVVTGMKKAFTLKKFRNLLRNAGLKIVSLDSEDLKCYVAVCVQTR